MKTVFYSDARNNLKSVCDEVADGNVTVLITRKNGGDVVMMSLEKYSKFLDIFNRVTNGLQLDLDGDRIIGSADLPSRFAADERK